MKVFAIISTLSCLLLANAEPPVPHNAYIPPQNSLQAPVGNYLPPSTSYGVPQQQQQQQQHHQRPSTSYGAPSALSNVYSAPSQQYNSPSQQYGAPSQQYNAPSQQYGAPSQQYSAPSSSYRAPSASYGAPAVTAAVFRPQSTYGVPQQQQQQGYGHSQGGYGNGGGYEYNEPAKYSFEYNVQDYPSGNDFGHMEQRDGDKTVGRYYVLLPDGRKQIVNYEADEHGYRPTITYEIVGNGNAGGNYPASGGYNNNGKFNGY